MSVLLLTGCASSPSVDTISPRSRIVGTWRRMSIDGRRVTGSHYIRYYSDGTSAWWPAPAGKFSTNGVTYTRYQVDGNVLNSDPRPDSLMNHRYSLLKFRGDTMTVIGEETDRSIYRRVVPDLEPGT